MRPRLVGWINKLSESNPRFHSEADFQFALSRVMSADGVGNSGLNVAATCPGLTAAGRERISTLARGHQLQLSPRRTGTDGFFIALFERRP